MRGPPIPWIRGLLPAAAVVVASQLAIAAISGWPATTEEFWGPDPYMRVARTLTCAGGRACPGGVFPFTNAPFGEVLHWPFLQDRLLIAMAVPLTPLIGRHDGVLVAASLFGPLLAIGSVALILLASRNLVPPPGLYFVGVLLACQPWVFQAFAAPQVDHHGLQGFLFLGMVTGAVYVLANPRAWRWSAMTGAFLGLALWVSTEALVSALPILVGLTALWVVRGGSHVARANRTVAFVTVGVLTLGLLVDGPPGEALARQYDRFSVVHWTVFALLAGLWSIAEIVERHWETRLRTRVACACVGAVVWAAGIAALFPDFFGGPMVDMDARLASIWLERTSEFVPVAGEPRPLVVSLHLASSLLGLPAAVACAVWGDPTRRSRWVLLLGACVWFAGLALLLQGRWALYLQLLIPIPLAWLLGLVLRRSLSAPHALLRPLGTVMAVIAFVAFPLLLALAFARTEVRRGAAPMPTCSASAIIPFLRELEAEHGPGTVLAPADWGPEIVFRTRHRAVASPYHRNASGLLDSYAFMSATDEQAAQTIAERRAIDWVVLCGLQPWFPVVEVQEEGTLYADLSALRTPSWLRNVTLPDSLARSFRVFEVVQSPSGGAP